MINEAFTSISGMHGGGDAEEDVLLGKRLIVSPSASKNPKYFFQLKELYFLELIHVLAGFQILLNRCISLLTILFIITMMKRRVAVKEVQYHR